jgi:GNAT superfamily N-acetyltransferase
VRRICYDTAYYGRSMAACGVDPLLLTDSLLLYYFRFESDAIFIADVDGEVAGYLAGSRSTVRFEWLFTLRVIPRLALDFVRRGRWHKSSSWQMTMAAMTNGTRLSRARRPFAASYPAHLHVNLDSRFRGQGLGSALVTRFLALLEFEGIRGVHVSTPTEAGAAFFAKLGFRELATFATRPYCGEEPGTEHLAGRLIHDSAVGHDAAR